MYSKIYTCIAKCKTKYVFSLIGGGNRAPTNNKCALFFARAIKFQNVQGVKCNNRTKSYPKLSAMGLNFTIDMTGGRLILRSLSKKRPKNLTPDTRGAGKW